MLPAIYGAPLTMGRYLQDVMYVVYAASKEQGITAQQQEILKSNSLIASLFNLYLPKKFEVGNSIWRFIINLTLENKLDEKTKEAGLVQESYVYYDFNKLISLRKAERRKVLLELFLKGVELCCKMHNCSLEPFKMIEQKLLADGIEFNGYYKDKKVSPDKKHSAQLKACFSEDSKQVFMEVFDIRGAVIQSVLIGDFDFRAFDRVQWVDRETVNIYHINDIQSYKRRKVAEDYFSINIQIGNVAYHPVTRESIFNYGVKLLTETGEHERALELIHQAKKLGHGKAENILRNLETNPEQRNKAILLQTPKKR